MKNRIIISVLFLLQACLLMAQTSIDISKGLTLENELVSFEFEQENMGLSSMKDLTSGHEHINAVNGKHLLWEVVFAK